MNPRVTKKCKTQKIQKNDFFVACPLGAAIPSNVICRSPTSCCVYTLGVVRFAFIPVVEIVITMMMVVVMMVAVVVVVLVMVVKHRFGHIYWIHNDRIVSGVTATIRQLWPLRWWRWWRCSALLLLLSLGSRSGSWDPLLLRQWWH